MQESAVKILKAAALEYREGMYAPVLKAYGEGNIAQKIIELAEKYNIPVREGEAEELLSALREMKVNSRVPAELYMALARIFAFLHTSQADSSREGKT